MLERQGELRKGRGERIENGKRERRLRKGAEKREKRKR